EGARSERLRLPPQVGPQPTHPVCQSIAWHPEVCGDIAVLPAVYYPALQQPAVVCAQIPEEGVKSVTSHGMHWGDLGQQVTGIPVVHLTDGHRAAVAPWCTSLPPVLVRASKYLETCPRPSGRPGDTTTGHLLERRPRPGRVGMPTGPVRQGVGIIAAWFAAGM